MNMYHDTRMESDNFPHSAVGILGLELRPSGLAPSPFNWLIYLVGPYF